MVHPSQQRSLVTRRKSQPCIAISRDGKVRHINIRPWAAALAITGFTVFSAAYLGATGYLIYRDDLLGGSLVRQVAMQYAYEDRIAALRSEIDRVTSRHFVETQGVGEQLAILLGRQAVIERHRMDLEQLVERAEDNGIDVAAKMARLPRSRPQAEVAAAASDAGEALAYAPSTAAADDIITGTLIRGAGREVELSGDLKPILSQVQSSLDAATDRQSDTLDTLMGATQTRIEELSSVLAPIGVGIEDGEANGPQGGPFVPAGGLHFVEQAALLNRTLDNIAALRQAADAMPIRSPVEASRLSGRFGPRMDPFLHRPAQHSGLDFAAAAGAEVRATGPGIVVSAGWNGGYGQMVEVRHPNGLTTRYAHLSAVLVASGARVSAGTPVGRVGSTGRSTGPHLHYETRRDGKAVDPAPYMAAGRAF